MALRRLSDVENVSGGTGGNWNEYFTFNTEEPENDMTYGVTESTIPHTPHDMQSMETRMKEKYGSDYLNHSFLRTPPIKRTKRSNPFN